MAPTVIYALLDPETGSVRYVGKTSERIEKRFARHLRETSKGSTRPARWIASVLERGLTPAFEVLEVVAADAPWQTRERHWIAHYRARGDLTNHSDGGDGLPGFVPTAEMRAAVAQGNRSRVWTAEARSKLSAAQQRKAEAGLNPRQKLRPLDVLDIRHRSAAGERHRVLMEKYGVSSVTVSKIVNRRTWKWLAPLAE